MLRQAIAGADLPREPSVAAVNRRGRPVTVRVICSPLGNTKDAGPRGAVLVMGPQDA